VYERVRWRGEGQERALVVEVREARDDSIGGNVRGRKAGSADGQTPA
jgi:hypothetical protein